MSIGCSMGLDQVSYYSMVCGELSAHSTVRGGLRGIIYDVQLYRIWILSVVVTATSVGPINSSTITGGILGETLENSLHTQPLQCLLRKRRDKERCLWRVLACIGWNWMLCYAKLMHCGKTPTQFSHVEPIPETRE
ncbi:hypothetical protein AV530_008729 [Patagioenas fasciata monilis]|uniref:Uncharacterized protein n=1 Tax=Patagioenas fasciata monilis TaxID=372326 RepID=A0A1V4L1H5_PATFA|nr:hypothetical protein AV530_008729 [Patagioenas fasciata monilis]